MKVFEQLSGLFRKNAGARKGDLHGNMEKALQMKQEAGDQRNIPPHETPRDGAIHGEQQGMTDRANVSEGSHTPQFKRSRVARSGDAS